LVRPSSPCKNDREIDERYVGYPPFATFCWCLDQGLLRADTLRSVGTTNETDTSESGLRLNAWIAPQAVFPQAGLPIDGCALPTYCQRRTPAARRAGFSMIRPTFAFRGPIGGTILRSWKRRRTKIAPPEFAA